MKISLSADDIWIVIESINIFYQQEIDTSLSTDSGYHSIIGPAAFPMPFTWRGLGCDIVTSILRRGSWTGPVVCPQHREM